MLVRWHVYPSPVFIPLLPLRPDSSFEEEESSGRVGEGGGGCSECIHTDCNDLCCISGLVVMLCTCAGLEICKETGKGGVRGGETLAPSSRGALTQEETRRMEGGG